METSGLQSGCIKFWWNDFITFLTKSLQGAQLNAPCHNLHCICIKWILVFAQTFSDFDRRLYLMSSVILSQWRERRMWHRLLCRVVSLQPVLCSIVLNFKSVCALFHVCKARNLKFYLFWNFCQGYHTYRLHWSGPSLACVVCSCVLNFTFDWYILSPCWSEKLNTHWRRQTFTVSHKSRSSE